jgi:hypothetical protein
MARSAAAHCCAAAAPDMSCLVSAVFQTVRAPCLCSSCARPVCVRFLPALCRTKASLLRERAFARAPPPFRTGLLLPPERDSLPPVLHCGFPSCWADSCARTLGAPVRGEGAGLLSSLGQVRSYRESDLLWHALTARWRRYSTSGKKKPGLRPSSFWQLEFPMTKAGELTVRMEPSAVSAPQRAREPAHRVN